MASTRYPNPEKFANQKTVNAFTLCRNRINGHFCNRLIPCDSRLCARCLHRAHSPECPSPNRDCTCGFSQLFWSDVAAWSAFHNQSVLPGVEGTRAWKSCKHPANPEGPGCKNFGDLNDTGSNIHQSQAKNFSGIESTAGSAKTELATLLPAGCLRPATMTARFWRWVVFLKQGFAAPIRRQSPARFGSKGTGEGKKAKSHSAAPAVFAGAERV